MNILKWWKRKNKEEISPKYTQEDIDCFKNQILDEGDIDRIIHILSNLEGSDLYSEFNDNHQELKKRCFKQALLTFGYYNFKNIVSQDYFGEHNTDWVSNRAASENGEDPSTVAAAYFQIPILTNYHKGWDLGKKLNIKVENDIKISFKL